MPATIAEVMQANTDRDGMIHIGDANRGCWNCGTVEMKYAGNGRLVLHHPGTECCAPAIKRLIELNRKELERHRNDAREFQQAIEEMDVKAERNVGKDAAEARMKADSMRRAFDTRKRDHWGPLVDGAHGEPGLKDEIARLERKLRELGAA